MTEGGHQAVYRIVRRIPRGRVATYGQIAALSGRAGAARQIGYALAALPDHSTVPWHRVVNAKGRLSLARMNPSGGLEQRIRLEAEGVTVYPGDRVDLSRAGWRPSAKRRGRKEETP